MEFVVDKAALGQVFSELFASPANYLFHLISSHSSSIIQGWCNRPLMA
jgi:hypothetical protein